MKRSTELMPILIHQHTSFAAPLHLFMFLVSLPALCYDEKFLGNFRAFYGTCGGYAGYEIFPARVDSVMQIRSVGAFYARQKCEPMVVTVK